MAVAGAKQLGLKVGDAPFFDTVRVEVGDAASVIQAAVQEGVNLRQLDSKTVTIAIDETTRLQDIDQLFKVLNKGKAADFSAESLAGKVGTLV